MATEHNEGFKPVLSHLDVKNRKSVAAWEERVWQRQRRSDFVDPRDEHGRQQFRKHAVQVGDLRQTARKLREKRDKQD